MLEITPGGPGACFVAFMPVGRGVLAFEFMPCGSAFAFFGIHASGLFFLKSRLGAPVLQK